MLLAPEVLHQHWDYNIWATNRLLTAAEQLSPEELTRDFKTADNSVLETLGHVFWSETIWLGRFKRVSAPRRPAKGAHDLDYYRQHWPLLHEEWRTYLSGVSDPTELLGYKDLKGQDWTHPIWVLLFHAVNHSTHHRGQVSGFLRAMGYIPPPLDLIAYHRQPSA
ncbi:MAG: DinB family protein [Bryobacteraceae bacterium]